MKLFNEVPLRKGTNKTTILTWNSSLHLGYPLTKSGKTLNNYKEISKWTWKIECKS